MIKLSKISFSYGYEPVFDEVSFFVPNGKKIALVGSNGAGKTTLFKLLTKEEMPSSGKVEVNGKLTLVLQEVKKDRELEKAANYLDYIDPEHLHGKFEITEILNGLEFDATKITTDLTLLSGGQKTKLALAKAFLAKPDILLLDEPTNFLDEAGKKWVMYFLAKYPKTVIVVSHDVALLDRHVNQVLYLNTQTRKIDSYAGNYTNFLKTKQQKDAFMTRQIKNQQVHIHKLEKSVAKLRQTDNAVRQRVVQQRRLQRMKDILPPMPQELRSIKASFPPPQKIGEVVISANHLFKSYGDSPVLQDVSLFIKRGERFALMGPNGVGKTTLIKILTGVLESDSGTVERSESLNYGYYSQEFQNFDEQKTVQEAILESTDLQPQQVFPILARFLFSRIRLKQRIDTLSGGEKTRLSIARLMLQQHNLLILDEPTTYLDVLSQRIILEALKDYTGAMLIVSHTKEFIRELQPQRSLILPENRTVFWVDDLSDKATEV